MTANFARCLTLIIVAPTFASLMASAQPSPTVPDFSGMWGRNSFAYETPSAGLGPVENISRLPSGIRDRTTLVGDDTNPILTPEAASAVKRFGEQSRRGIGVPDPNNQCWPEGPPYIYRVLVNQIIQRRDEIVILYTFDHQFRRIRLNQPHPAKIVPSWYGDSVGHFEGDTLVVDTVGVKLGPFSMIDRLGTPYSEQLHVVERFRLIERDAADAVMRRNEQENGRIAPDGGGGRIDPNDMGKGLQVQFTVDDPKTFTAPWSATVTFRRTIDPWDERVCAENLRNYGVAADPKVPTSATPDF